jgi:hypothetical protein
MKIRPVGAEFHPDRQTHMTELIAAFRNFQTCPKSSPDIMPRRQRGGVEVQLYSFFNPGTICW